MTNKYTVIDDKAGVIGLKIINLMEDDDTKEKALLCLDKNNIEVILRIEGELYISENVKKVE